MSAANIQRLVIGETIGNATILRLVFDASNYRDRTYEVRLECCGKSDIRTQKFIREGERRRRTRCASCEAKARRDNQIPQPRGLPFRIGEVIGIATVIGEGSSPLHKIIRLACCGTETEVNHQRLHKLRSDAKHGRPDHMCWTCYTKERYGQPRQRTVAAPTVMLPPGILSAAVAWPRPRLGA